MNATENMHEVGFPNLYILSDIIYYIPPLIIIIVLAIKVAGFSKARKTFSNTFTKDFGDIKYQI